MQNLNIFDFSWCFLAYDLPDTKINPFALIACEYGPIAAGALAVEITSLSTPVSFVSISGSGQDRFRGAPSDMLTTTH